MADLVTLSNLRVSAKDEMRYGPTYRYLDGAVHCRICQGIDPNCPVEQAIRTGSVKPLRRRLVRKALRRGFGRAMRKTDKEG